MAIKRKPAFKPKNRKVAIEHTQFYGYLLRYIEAMLLRNYSKETMRRTESVLRVFSAWCDDRGVQSPQEVTKAVMESYQKYLLYFRQNNGESLAAKTRFNYLSSVKQFFKWLNQENYLLFNPASDVVMPKVHKPLPTVLTEEEVQAILSQPNVALPNGVRDRAILELFYSTGIRRKELCDLNMNDVNPHRKTLHVREGKGGKSRLVPIGDRALEWLTKYLESVRLSLLLDIEEPALFINDYGEPFSTSKLGDRVKRYMLKAEVNVTGSCHLLRHAMATHMLENGAEMRYIQAMLGHESYDSTQRYAHVSIRKLQEIHTATHPAKAEKRGEI